MAIGELVKRTSAGPFTDKVDLVIGQRYIITSIGFCKM